MSPGVGDCLLELGHGSSVGSDLTRNLGRGTGRGVGRRRGPDGPGQGDPGDPGRGSGHDRGGHDAFALALWTGPTDGFCHQSPPPSPPRAGWVVVVVGRGSGWVVVVVVGGSVVGGSVGSVVGPFGPVVVGAGPALALGGSDTVPPPIGAGAVVDRDSWAPLVEPLPDSGERLTPWMAEDAACGAPDDAGVRFRRVDRRCCSVAVNVPMSDRSCCS